MNGINVLDILVEFRGIGRNLYSRYIGYLYDRMYNCSSGTLFVLFYTKSTKRKDKLAISFTEHIRK